MSKQDRTYSRTPADLELKYNLGRNAQGGSENNSEQVSKVVQELSEHKTEANNKFKELHSEIDVTGSLAAANQAAHIANAAAIVNKASQTDLNAVSGRVTNLEEWKEDFTEITSKDIEALFLENEG